MTNRFAESVVEDAALAWLKGLGFAILHGPEIAIGMPGAERTDPGYRDVVLERRVRQALVRLNPELPPEALEDAFRKLMRADAPSLIERNRAAHRMLVDGVTVEYRRADGSIAGAQARVLDFDTPESVAGLLRRCAPVRGDGPYCRNTVPQPGSWPDSGKAGLTWSSNRRRAPLPMGLGTRDPEFQSGVAGALDGRVLRLPPARPAIVPPRQDERAPRRQTRPIPGGWRAVFAGRELRPVGRFGRQPR